MAAEGGILSQIYATFGALALSSRGLPRVLRFASMREEAKQKPIEMPSD